MKRAILLGVLAAAGVAVVASPSQAATVETCQPTVAAELPCQASVPPCVPAEAPCQP
ncbi:MAG: hypothetical protein VKP70_06120 [Cyanobacteriota bacterium]|nr:hypothetical protein [Cyanobacteriota bacterium]